MTIPHHIVRAWKLEHGSLLAIQSTDHGILLFPRFFAARPSPARLTRQI
jgi:hypothetical protein